MGPAPSSIDLDVNLRSAPQRLEYELIADRIAADRPGRLLDWGCGWGQITRMLRDRGVDAVAFDYRPDAPGEGTAMLERFPEIEAHVSPDPVRLPFADSQFDAALSCGVLEHVHDPHASLDELGRVLRPGGRLYVYKLPNRLSYLERIARALGRYYHGALEHDRVYTLKSAAELVEAHRFEVIEARRANMLPLTLSGRMATRLARPIWSGSRVLARVPGISRFATNVELVAVRRLARASADGPCSGGEGVHHG